MPTVHLLDYVAGNVRSLVNAINKVGYDVEWVKNPEDLKNADVSISLSSAKINFPCLYLQCINRIAETYTARSWPFRPLSLSAFRGRVSRTDKEAHRFWETFHGDLCRSTSTV